MSKAIEGNLTVLDPRLGCRGGLGGATTSDAITRSCSCCLQATFFSQFLKNGVRDPFFKRKGKQTFIHIRWKQRSGYSSLVWVWFFIYMAEEDKDAPSLFDFEPRTSYLDCRGKASIEPKEDESDSLVLHSGSCHCGKVQFECEAPAHVRFVCELVHLPCSCL